MGTPEKFAIGSVLAAAAVVGPMATAAYAQHHGEMLVDPAVQMPPAQACAADVAELAGSRTEAVETAVLPKTCHDYLDPEFIVRIPTPNGTYMFELPSAQAIIAGKKAWLRANRQRIPIALKYAGGAGTLSVELLAGIGFAGAVSARRKHKQRQPQQIVEVTA
ncbi:hypothetical protein KDA14_04410 [Candidatus Saccharibacteria bacterium]|nr:hypothetical protein [Candidatus Saccharibacteria bacterium]